MINKLSVLLSEEISLRLNSSDDEKEIYAYSIEVLFSLVVNICILTVTSIILKKQIELIIFTLFFAGLRAYAGGYHSKTHIECFAITLSIFLMSSLSSTFFTAFGKAILIFGTLFSIAMVFWLAPSESPNKPLSEKRRKRNKIISRAIVIIFSIAAIVLYYMKDKVGDIYITATMAMIIESISLVKK